jgi:hypothetical protein
MSSTSQLAEKLAVRIRARWFVSSHRWFVSGHPLQRCRKSRRDGPALAAGPPHAAPEGAITCPHSSDCLKAYPDAKQKSQGFVSGHRFSGAANPANPVPLLRTACFSTDPVTKTEQVNRGMLRSLCPWCILTNSPVGAESKLGVASARVRTGRAAFHQNHRCVSNGCIGWTDGASRWAATRRARENC